MTYDNVKFLEVRCELGAGTRGASLGIDALRIAAINAKSTIFLETEVETVTANHQLLHRQSDTPNALHIEGIAHVYQSLAQKTKAICEAGNMPLVLAGDHSTAAATIGGLKAAYPDKRIGVIWIDAHADLHSPYTTPSGNVHGMPIAAVLGADNLRCQRNQLSPKEATLWENLKSIGIPGPKVKPQDIVMIAVRDTEPEEDALIREWDIKNFTVSEVRTMGAAEVGRTSMQMLQDCDMVYVTFDVDSMDSIAVSAGTGTPVIKGLYLEEAKELMAFLASDPSVSCMEIVEVNPLLDQQNTMAEAAFEVLESVYLAIKKRKKAHAPVSHRNQRHLQSL